MPKLDSVLTATTIVESMLPRFSGKHLGLHMIFQFRYEDMGYDKSGDNLIREPWRKHYDVELLFIRHMNYTKVLGRVSDFDENKFHSLTWSLGEEVVLKQYSDHDSCWRSDGFVEFFQTFMNAIDAYEKDRDGADLREHLDEFHHFALGGSPVYVEIESCEPVDSNDRWNTDYKVKIKRTLTVKQAVELMPED